MNIGMVIALIKKLATTPDPEVITEAVDAYLEEHPLAIDDTAGEGDTGKVWSADKIAGEVATLTEAIATLEPTASASDVGKFLKAKTVSGGKVTEYEFGSGSGGGGAEIDDTAGHGDTTVVWSAGKTYDEIEKVKPGDYRLIKEITVSGSDTAAVLIDTDNNSEPFSLKDVIIDFDMKISEGASNGIVMPNVATAPSDAENIPYLLINNLFKTSGNNRRFAQLHVDGGKFFGESLGDTVHYHYYSTGVQRSRNSCGTYDCDPIEKIRIWSINGHKFGAGSTIKIYGR